MSKGPKKKARAPVLSARPRIQQSTSDHSAGAGAGAGAGVRGVDLDSADYLYGGDTGSSSNSNSKNNNQVHAQKLTRRAVGASSLPQLSAVPGAISTAARDGGVGGGGGGDTTGKAKARVLGGGVTKSKKPKGQKAVRGAPNLGGLVTRRK